VNVKLLRSQAIDNVDMGVSRVKMMKGKVGKAEAPATALLAKQAESDAFNRHYNKELKVSEGKWSRLICRRDTTCAPRTERKRIAVHLKRSVRECTAITLKSPRGVGCG
jgi:hypothetical protein